VRPRKEHQWRAGRSGAARRKRSEIIHTERYFVMSKAICALKAALGVRGNFCQLGQWRWYVYHNI